MGRWRRGQNTIHGWEEEAEASSRKRKVGSCVMNNESDREKTDVVDNNWRWGVGGRWN